MQYKNTKNLALSKFIADYDDDVSQIPTDVEPGSEIFVIESSSRYMLNHEEKWVKLKTTSSNNNFIDTEENFTVLGTTVE